MAIPLPPGVRPPTEDDKKLTDNEALFIINSCLPHAMQNDPTVLRFIDSYVSCRNVSQAARHAGVNLHQGRKWKNNTFVNDAITKLTMKSIDKYGFNAEEVVERIRELTDSNVFDWFNDDGTIKHPKEMPPEAQRTVKSFKVKETWGQDPNGVKYQNGRIVDIEFYDKIKASELIGPEKGVFRDQLDVNVHKQISIVGALGAAEQRLAVAKDVTPTLEIEAKNE